MASEWTGQRLQKLLDDSDWTIERLADRLGVVTQSIENWLANKHRPSRVHRRTLDRIERGLRSQQVIQ